MADEHIWSSKNAGRGATTVLVLGTGILVLFSVLPGLLLGLMS